MTLRNLARPLAVAALLLSAAPWTRADEFIDRANGLYRTIRTEKRSDLVLLPLLAKMDAPPASVATPDRAFFMPAGSAGWSAAEQWAQAAPQKAVLDALTTVTKEERPEEAMAFGQPYGADALGASPEGVALIRANLYTDLGDPPVLAGAKHLYLPALEKMESLVNVEATRLAAAGKINDALMTMVHWLFFSRQMADRQMYQEARWGVRAMGHALQRIRDIAYVDSRGAKALTTDQILAVIEELRSQGGFLRLERLSFPEANRYAAEQALARVFDRSGAPGPDFGQTMARLASTQRPLRLFAEVARWDQAASGHANLRDTQAELSKIYGDLAGRWPLDVFDVRMVTPTDLEKMDSDRYAVLAAVVPDMRPMFNDRQILRTEAVGTRCALGILAFSYNAKSFPPQIESIRPRFLKVIEADPYNGDRARGKQPPLQYFVPIRDEKERFSSGETPHPHEITIVSGSQNFQVSVGDDQFVLYSLGPDGDKGWADTVFARPMAEGGGDVLLWPPVPSLLRQRLVESGALK